MNRKVLEKLHLIKFNSCKMSKDCNIVYPKIDKIGSGSRQDGMILYAANRQNWNKDRS